jgi:hypothetical protein
MGVTPKLYSEISAKKKNKMHKLFFVDVVLAACSEYETGPLPQLRDNNNQYLTIFDGATYIKATLWVDLKFIL